jgi:hypothetical protein
MLRVVFSRAALFPWLGLALMGAGALFPEGSTVGIVLVVIGANVAFYSLFDFGQNFAWEADARTVLALCHTMFPAGLVLVVFAALPDRSNARIALLAAGTYLCIFAVWTVQQPVSLPYRVLAVVGFVLMTLGGIAGYLGWQEWRVFAESDATPQDINLEDLLQNGHGTNRHVRLKEFRFCDRHATEKTGKSARIKTSWFPVVPVDGQAVKKGGVTPSVPPRLTAIVSYLSLGDPDGAALRPGQEPLEARMRRDKEAKGYDCVVVTGIKRLQPEVRDQLTELAPQTDWSEVIVLKWGKPASPGTVYGCLGGGAAGFVLGLLCLGVVYFRARQVVGVGGPHSTGETASDVTGEQDPATP